ncbi:MAG: hypothetical protein EVJ48_01415 [Candidatus Acidulodesulfobacterium acidiphilum]|uniref:Uncharacterized protein n=1 Tax=Candidatus Acidulodesulfobacterium acidiphilum TaxID=2597224 RepID=A0A520XGD6_9DELT|nr:MAG: hypothetical protein EVJ48_01415 [Candidatus Acidulodesulfobacterium acidiphilum]
MMNFQPISLKLANEFVLANHRHNKPVAGHKFSIGLFDDERLIGVAICGRPVARMADDGLTLEILRVCTDGTRNANSMLYGRVKKIAQVMGYKKVLTYTLAEESGSSLRAVGAQKDGLVKPQEWSREKRKRETQNIYKKEKIRWIL